MNITVYTRDNCVQCHATKRVLESRGYQFELINLDHYPEKADELREKGFRQLPVVISDENSWCGFRPDMINRIASAPLVAHA